LPPVATARLHKRSIPLAEIPAEKADFACLAYPGWSFDPFERALAFYRDGLGLDSPSMTGTEFSGDEAHPAGAVVMFQLDTGLTLALYPRSELAKDAEIPPGPAQSGEFSLGSQTAPMSTPSSCKPRRPAPP